MSHLGFPRVIAAGQFYTDPSTVDNDPVHYDPKVTNPSPWQEPKGRHYFQFRGVQVVNAYDAAGAQAGDDPILGLAFETTDDPSPAKIVDLDVYQQGVSTIWGLKARLTFADGSAAVGALDPCQLNSFWFNAVLPQRGWNQEYGQDSPGGDFNACGYYQSVLRFPEASLPAGKSAVWDALVARCQREGSHVLVAIRFVVDGYDNNSGGFIDGDPNRPVNAGFRLGRFTATLGPSLVGEPVQAPGPRFLRGRRLAPDAAWNTPSLNTAPFTWDPATGTLVFDLANGVCRTYAGGPPCDLGVISARACPPGAPPVDLGTFMFNDFAYNNDSGLVNLKVTDPAAIRALESAPVYLVSASGEVLFREAEDGLWFAADQRSLRMTSEADGPATSLTARVKAWKFGQPAVGLTLGVQVVSVHGTTPGATVPPTNPGNTPQADGALAASLGITDRGGWADLDLSVLKDPGSRTPELDGQLYFLWLWSGNPPDPARGAGQEKTLSVVVWSSYEVVTDPAWPLIQGMMAPYMKLFPGMKDRIDLADQNTFFIFANNPPWTKVYGPLTRPYDLDGYSIAAGAIPFYMTRDLDDPRLMPLSRDLSPNKLKTVLYYVKKLQQTPVNPAQE